VGALLLAWPTDTQTVDSAAAQVVRLALFHEYRHAPLKRPAIKAGE
jgi:hypothetical protein